MKYTLHLLSLIALSAFHAQASVIDDGMRIRLQRAVDSIQRQEKIQGVSASVMMGTDSWSGCAGLSYSGRPLTPDMVLGIGSNSKTCTSIALLRLQEKGLLNLDEPIHHWIPRHPNIDTTITVRQLLNHTSGVGDYSAEQSYRDSCLADPLHVWQPSELLSLIPKAQFAPGTSGGYCNTNYFLAGIIAEKVSEQTLGKLFRRELFDPLEMDSTRLFPEEQVVGELAHRWMGGRDAYNVSMNAEWSGAWAAGAVMSTSSEMVQFYNALFSGSLLNDRSMFQLLVFIGPNNYGLGISKKTVGGEEVIGHTGEIRGYSSVILWVPSLRASIAVLTNSIPSSPVAVAAAIINILRQQGTAVGDADVLDTPELYPALVYDLQGRCLVFANHYSEVQMLPCGVYIFVRNSGSIKTLQLGCN